MSETPLHGPHRHIRVADDRERFLIQLFDTLWVRYRSRMEYVRKYEDMVEAHGATFVNDHVAFRAFALQKPAAGIFTISRIFEALGYWSAACYEFPDKHFNSIHFQHSNPRFPKLFITQLKTWELSARTRRIIEKAARTHRPGVTDTVLADLRSLAKVSTYGRAGLLKILARFFSDLPWDLPQKRDVLEVNEESQFGAWVMVNGYDVNHFTASVDSHQVEPLNDIEKTVSAMRAAGIPMKKEIEGERGTKLRQSSTEAVTLPVRVKDGAKRTTMPWSYAYFEIAERPLIKNPVTGQTERFEGFLGGQATNLFEMTKRAG
jgi:hypothetical protein